MPGVSGEAAGFAHGGGILESRTDVPKRTVLIVDDELFFRELLREMLEKNGYSVIAEASDGIAAVAQFRSYRPDLTIMDIFMPDGNGIEATRDILSIDGKARVLICSGVGYDDDIEAALQAGAREIIYKPFMADEVMESVAKAFSAD
jgi:two-component system chemotaxis response regulator CheY